MFNMLLLLRLILFKKARRIVHAGLFNLNQKEKFNRKQSRNKSFENPIFTFVLFCLLLLFVPVSCQRGRNQTTNKLKNFALNCSNK